MGRDRRYSGGIFFSVLVLAVSLKVQGAPAVTQADPRAECLQSTDVINGSLTCDTSNLSFTLKKGQVISVRPHDTGRTLEIPVFRAKKLEARISTLGMTEESVQFVGVIQGYIASVNIPCGQSRLAFVGLSNNTQVLPYETVAACHK